MVFISITLKSKLKYDINIAPSKRLVFFDDEKLFLQDFRESFEKLYWTSSNTTLHHFQSPSPLSKSFPSRLHQIHRSNSLSVEKKGSFNSFLSSLGSPSAATTPRKQENGSKFTFGSSKSAIIEEIQSFDEAESQKVNSEAKGKQNAPPLAAGSALFEFLSKAGINKTPESFNAKENSPRNTPPTPLYSSNGKKQTKFEQLTKIKNQLEQGIGRDNKAIGRPAGEANNLANDQAGEEAKKWDPTPSKYKFQKEFMKKFLVAVYEEQKERRKKEKLKERGENAVDSESEDEEMEPELEILLDEHKMEYFDSDELIVKHLEVLSSAIADVHLTNEIEFPPPLDVHVDLLDIEEKFKRKMKKKNQAQLSSPPDVIKNSKFIYSGLFATEFQAQAELTKIFSKTDFKRLQIVFFLPFSPFPSSILFYLSFSPYR